MIAKIAVSAARFSMDKPYSYRFGQELGLVPGIRVMVPFGNGNRRTEGVVLSIEEGDESKLKAVTQALDERPLITPRMLRLAAFIRERYFCTFYEAIRVMLPAGLWFREVERFSLAEDAKWESSQTATEDMKAICRLLSELGGETEEAVLKKAVPDPENREEALKALLKKKWITAACIALILAVGFSRMYLGVHTPYDVGTSLVTGALTVAGMMRLFDRAEGDARKEAKTQLVGLAFALALLAYVLFAPKRAANVAEFDAHGVTNAWKILGTMLGVMAAWQIDQRVTHYETKAVWWAQAI